MSFVNQYRSTTIYGELKVQKYNTGNIAGLLDVSGNALFRGDVGINGNIYATDGTVDISGNLSVSGNITGSIENATNATNVGITTDVSNQSFFPTFVSATSGNLPLKVDSSGITYNPSTNILTSTFAGNLTGNVTGNVTGNLTGTATNSTNSTIAVDSSNQSFFPTFVSATSGNLPLKVDSGITYNPSTNILTSTFAGNLTGNITGNVTGNVTGDLTGTSSKVNVTDVSTNASFRVPFLSGDTGSQTISSDAGFQYNPSSNVLSVGSVAGSLSGTSTFAQQVIPSENADNVNQRVAFLSAATSSAYVRTDAGLFYNPLNNILTCGFFDGIATNTTNVEVSPFSTNASFSIPFTSVASGNTPLRTDPGLTYNPSTNILSCDVSGNLTGTATNATKSTIATDSSNASFFLTFVADTSGNLPLKVDSGITYNPSTNVLETTGDAIINLINVGRGSGNITDNTALGGSALAANTTGTNNTALGKNALTSNSTGDNNTAVGYDALATNTTGDLNTGVGYGALLVNTAGSNTGIGFEALNANTTGSNNTSVGQSSMTNNLTGSFNTAVGDNALDSNTDGSFNTAVGSNAGFTNLTGSNNTFLGYNTDISGNFNHSTALGADAKISSSNQIVLGTASDSVLIPGPLSVTGTITGTATNVNVTEVGTNASFRMPFLSSNTGSATISSDAGMNYNPSTETLTVTNINGTITNNAATSTIATDSSNQSFFPTFVSATSGNLPLKVDNGITYNPSTNILSCNVTGDLTGTATTATNVTATANNTNSAFSVPFLSAASGSVAIRSDTGLNYNPSTEILTATTLNCSFNSGQGAGVWLVNGSTANTALEAVIPLFCSQTNLGNINDQGSLTEVSVSGAVVGSYISNFSLNNLVDIIVLFPRWGIIGYDGAGYASTVRINLHNDQATPVFAQTTSNNTLSSCRIYYNKVEVTGLGS